MRFYKTFPESRRAFVKKTATLAVGAVAPLDWLSPETEPDVFQAMGTRAGDITASSAIIWVRLTATEKRNAHGLVIPGRAQQYKETELPKVTVPVDQLEGACPGASGQVRIRYTSHKAFRRAKTTGWVSVTQDTDFIHHFELTGLLPDTTYYYRSEATGQRGNGSVHTSAGTFRTAPANTSPTELTFCLMTCQGYPDRDHPDGHNIYPAMQALNPAFACMTGDLVYYDNDMPRAYTKRLAQYHWERMFSLPRLANFTSNVGAYWLKDDHDTLDNDSGPGGSMGEFTFAEGQKLFALQAPIRKGLSYRTFRWGRDLQLWFTDGRDFRSDNDMPDGPDKTIWGIDQKRWFMQTVKDSNATWKILVSPTPLVGPDRGKKNDNHANTGFRFEGDEIRNWLKDNVPDNFFVICGDRHWQYHSVHPKTGVQEFSIGPASDEHASGSPGEDKAYHRFHRVKGGFISVNLARKNGQSLLTFRHHDVHGTIVYQHETQRPV